MHSLAPIFRPMAMTTSSTSFWTASISVASVLLEEPEALDVELLQEQEAEAKAETEKSRPGLAIFTDGSRLARRSRRVLGGLARWTSLGGRQNPRIWLQPRILRRGVRGPRQG